MKVRWALAIFSLSIFSPIADAFFYTYSFGDLASCKYVIVGGERMESSDIYMRWEAKAELLNKSLGPQDDKWEVFYIANETSDFSQVGTCRTISSQKGSPVAFECNGEAYGGFPLAGATFKLHTYKGRATYRCAKGCGKNVPVMLYDNGYEEPGNADLDKFLERFDRACKKK